MTKLTNYFSTQGRTAPLPGFTTGFITVIPGGANRMTAENVSFSAVCHVTKWLSVLYNQAENTAVPRSPARCTAPPAARRRRAAGTSTPASSSQPPRPPPLRDRHVFRRPPPSGDFDAGGVLAADVEPDLNALDAAGVPARNGLLLGNVLDTTTGLDLRRHRARRGARGHRQPLPPAGGSSPISATPT